ncbi:helix-turn-helix domain-containing protein [Halorussus amylolyticus]|uniref:helix-turn-helix domain-containing protein n=1 Tax=Halorussus amylolyticus TaxID=1126242 RepID=UPI00138F82B2|nr:helix-turn-helix domain-containing protein [Halorussus amylolyticus]
MSVIAELRIPAGDFELGRVLEVVGTTTVELETMVPAGEKAVPFFWVYEADRADFEESVQDHPSVENLTEVDTVEGRTLYALDWTLERDLVLEGVMDQQGQILAATGTSSFWEFELRFPSHDALAGFKQHCAAAHISLDLRRIYNPTKPDAGPWYGLTARQREALLLAVREGYYEIPRGRSTVEVADMLDISDQALTERLRRAITTLVENSLMLDESDVAAE